MKTLWSVYYVNVFNVEVYRTRDVNEQKIKQLTTLIIPKGMKLNHKQCDLKRI